MLRETCTVILSFTFKATLRHVRTRRRRAASSLLLLHLRHRLRSVMCAARRRLRVNPSDSESRDNFHRWRRSRCITSSFQRPNHTGCCTPSTPLLHSFASPSSTYVRHHHLLHFSRFNSHPRVLQLTATTLSYKQHSCRLRRQNAVRSRAQVTASTAARRRRHA